MEKERPEFVMAKQTYVSNLCTMKDTSGQPIKKAGFDASDKLHKFNEYEVNRVEKDIFKDFPDYNIVSGYVYQYNVDKNIELMRRFYPNMKKVAFISDNTYGGLSMQAFVKKEMKKYPELELMLLDGRNSSFLEVSERIRHLPNDVCVLVGTA